MVAVNDSSFKGMQLWKGKLATENQISIGWMLDLDEHEAFGDHQVVPRLFFPSSVTISSW